MTRESLTLDTFGSSSWMQISWHSTNSPCNHLELLEVWMRPQRIPTKDHPLPVGRPILSRHSDRQTDGRAVIPRWTKDAQIAFRFALQHAHSLASLSPYKYLVSTTCCSLILFLLPPSSSSSNKSGFVYGSLYTCSVIWLKANSICSHQ